MAVNTINQNNKKSFRSSSSLDRDAFEFVLSQLDQGMIEFLEDLKTMEVDLINSRYNGKYTVNQEQFIKSIANIFQIDEDQIFQVLNENPNLSNNELYAILIQLSGLSEFEFFKRLMIENEDIEGLENLLLCEQIAKDCNIEIEDMMGILFNPNLERGEIMFELAKSANMSELELVQRLASNRLGSQMFQSVELFAKMCNMSEDELMHAFNDYSNLDENEFMEYLMQKSGMTEEEILAYLSNPTTMLDLDQGDQQIHSYSINVLEELAKRYGLSMEQLIEELDQMEDLDEKDPEDIANALSRSSKLN